MEVKRYTGDNLGKQCGCRLWVHHYRNVVRNKRVVHTCGVLHCGEKEEYTSIVVPCDVDPEVYTQEFYILPMCAHHFSQLGKGFPLELSKEAILVSPERHKRCKVKEV